MYFKEEGVK